MMIKCSKCGFENEAGHIYCAKCKTKLNLEQISSNSFHKSPVHRNFRLQILQFIFLVIIICFACALWPVPLETVNISGPEFVSAKNKLTKLQQGVLAEPVDFSEKEINILFNYLIQKDRHRPNFKAGLISIYASQVQINPETMTIYLGYQVGSLMVGPITSCPFWLTYEVTGRPESGPDSLRFSALNGAVGHLPLPFLGGSIGKTRLQRIFVPFKNARVFLGRIEIIGIYKNSIRVKYSKYKKGKT